MKSVSRSYPDTAAWPYIRREIKFIIDVHLGKLKKHLRLLGFDTIYNINFSDDEIIECARQEGRIILTRDLGILRQKRVTHGYWMRNTDPNKQLIEVFLNHYSSNTNVDSSPY